MRTSALRVSTSLTRALLAPSRSSIRHNAITLYTPPPARPSIGLRKIHQSLPRRQGQVFADELQDAQPSTITKFEELAEHNILHRNIVRTLTQDMKLSEMTEVQSRTINQAIKGADIVAQARTGTGKTLAFLMPVLQNIINRDPDLARPNMRARGPRTTADDIRALIISPTRELAEQIAVEAKRLVAGTSVVVQTAVGGTQKLAGLRAIQRDGCHILVGTPGRLHDLLTDSFSRVQAPDLSALVFDEADRLLDQGFWPAIQNIMGALPSIEEKDRQTLMFSATVPHEVVDMVRRTLKPGFEFVQCVNQDEEPTHARVPQKIVVTHGFENNNPALVELCTREIRARQASNDRPFKAIVYFPSTAEVSLTCQLLQNLEIPPTGQGDDAAITKASNNFFVRKNHPWPSTQIIEIHSKLGQSQRTRAADNFRAARSGILLSSDVTARGLDFPDVTHVIQMSTPPNQDQYIHRIGRTARAGKEGEGWLIVGNYELAETRKTLGRLPIKRDDSLETPSLDLSQELQVSANAGTVLSMIQKAMQKVNVSEKIKAYRALIGVYQKHGDKAELIANMNRLSQFGWGLREPPMIAPGLAQKLGLSRIPGIRIGHDPREEYDDDKRRPFDGGRRGFGRGGFDQGFTDRGGFVRGGSDRGGFDRGSRSFGEPRGSYNDRGHRQGVRDGGPKYSF